MPDRVQVRCYAGSRGEETPRAVVLDGREVMIGVEHGWVEEPVGAPVGERRRVFQIRLGDGRRGHLAQEPDGSWTLTPTASGRSGPP
jgi:hypothetical protein